MKQLALLLFITSIATSTAHAQFAEGSGTEEDPYQVETLEHLQLIADSLYLDKHFIQIADIDAGEAENGIHFNPIGELETPFTGTYDGAGFTISGLTISLDGGIGAGLFGYAENARIKNTGLGNTTVSGNIYVGGLVGWFRGGWISNSFSKGTVSASSRAGGLVGYNWGGEISDSYATGDVSGNFRIGGLVGVNVDKGAVATSYASGKVTGSDAVGGLVGENEASVTNSYWDMESTGQSDGIGYGDVDGATGLSTSEMTGASAYDYMSALDFRRVWLLTEGYPALDWEDVEAIEPPELEPPPMVVLVSPLDEAIVNDSKPVFYWKDAKDAFSYQIQISRDQDFDSPAVDKQEIEETFYATENSLQYNITQFWRVRGINPAGMGEWSETWSFTILDTPFSGGSGTEADPWHVSSVEQLQAINDHLDAHFLQIRDIDAGHTEFWDDGKGFYPLGNDSVRFTGTYDGAGLEISDLTIYREEKIYVSLFGYVDEGVIKNTGLSGASIIGYRYVGGLIGYNTGEISDSYVTGEISGGSSVGGLVGRNFGPVKGSLVVGVVTGGTIGGLIGWNNGHIQNSSVSGNILGTGRFVGGLIGRNNGDVQDSHVSGEVVQGTRWGYVGGLLGINSGNIQGSSFTGDVQGPRGSNVGGLIGSNSNTVKDSFADGSVSGRSRVGGLIGENRDEVRNSHATGNISGDQETGGLIGKNFGDIYESFATGNVTGERDTGGLTGLNTGDIIRSHASGDVIGDVFTGGLAGRNQRNIISSYAMGDVSGDAYVGGLTGSIAGVSTVQGSYSLGDVEGERLVGGFAGANLNDAQIHRSFSVGIVSGMEETGGFVGLNDAIIEQSYWDTEFSEQEQGIGSGPSTGAAGLTTDQMTGQSAFHHMMEFDFYNFWLLTENYPALFWEDVTATPPPPITIELSGPSNEQSGLPVRDTLRWQKNDWVDDYQLQISISDDFSDLIADSTVSDTQFVYDLDYGTTYFWRVKAQYLTGEGEWSDIWNFTTKLSTSAGNEKLPVTYKLNQNYPNPFNPETVIQYELPENNEVLLEVYDILGRRVAVLVNEMKQAGVHQTSWNASSAAGGTYIYQVRAGEFIQSRQMLLVK